MYSDWRLNFDSSKSPRKLQEQALDEITHYLDTGAKFVVGELPTGVGKSDIAMAIAKSAKSAYVTTPQNPLVDQYVRDFTNDPDFHFIKGRTHYKCVNSYGNCKEGSESKKCSNAKLPANKDDGTPVPQTCTYRIEKALATASKVCLTNASYYITACRGLSWPMRDITIIDECHNIAENVLEHVRININDTYLEKNMITEMIPEFPDKIVTMDQVMPYAQKLLEDITVTLAGDMLGHVPTEVKDNLKALEIKLIDFLDSAGRGAEWICDYELSKSGKGIINLRPVDVDKFAQIYFFTEQASKFVLQSATIINPTEYCKELGITEFKSVTKPTPFDLGRRPIYDMRIANMEARNADADAKCIDTVGKILKYMKAHKGVVHTGNMRLTNAMKVAFKDNPRCLFADFELGISREDIIRKHRVSLAPTVLFSPSLVEGFDGANELMRFGILCKIPYPDFFNDRRTKIKMERDINWYYFQTAKTLIQSMGRGMRNERDWCMNFVLDSRFLEFCHKARMPKEFLNSIYTREDGMRSLTNVASNKL